VDVRHSCFRGGDVIEAVVDELLDPPQHEASVPEEAVDVAEEGLSSEPWVSSLTTST
jgi:hypothetical protein